MSVWDNNARSPEVRVFEIWISPLWRYIAVSGDLILEDGPENPFRPHILYTISQVPGEASPKLQYVLRHYVGIIADVEAFAKARLSWTLRWEDVGVSELENPKWRATKGILNYT